MHHYQLKSTEMHLCTCVPVSDGLTCQKIREKWLSGQEKLFPWAGKKYLSLGIRKSADAK